MFLAGCANLTDDPRKGGLFSYSPEKYEKRLQDREATLAYEEADLDRSLRTNADLKKRKAAMQKEVKILRQQNARIEKKLKQAKKSSDSETSARAAELLREQQQLKQETAKLAAQNKETEAKRQEVERLKRELQMLEEEADALSRL